MQDLGGQECRFPPGSGQLSPPCTAGDGHSTDCRVVRPQSRTLIKILEWRLPPLRRQRLVAIAKTDVGKGRTTQDELGVGGYSRGSSLGKLHCVPQGRETRHATEKEEQAAARKMPFPARIRYGVFQEEAS